MEISRFAQEKYSQPHYSRVGFQASLISLCRPPVASFALRSSDYICLAPRNQSPLISSIGVSSTRLYLGNIPRNTSTREIKEYFNSHGAGRITDIKLMNGFVYIEYEDAIDARDIESVFHGSLLEGHRLFAREHQRINHDFWTTAITTVPERITDCESYADYKVPSCQNGGHGGRSYSHSCLRLEEAEFDPRYRGHPTRRNPKCKRMKEKLMKEKLTLKTQKTVETEQFRSRSLESMVHLEVPYSDTDLWGSKKLACWRETSGKGKEWRSCRLFKPSQVNYKTQIRKDCFLQPKSTSRSFVVPFYILRRNGPVKSKRQRRSRKPSAVRDRADLYHSRTETLQSNDSDSMYIEEFSQEGLVFNHPLYISRTALTPVNSSERSWMALGETPLATKPNSQTRSVDSGGKTPTRLAIPHENFVGAVIGPGFRILKHLRSENHGEVYAVEHISYSLSSYEAKAYKLGGISRKEYSYRIRNLKRLMDKTSFVLSFDHCGRKYVVNGADEGRSSCNSFSKEGKVGAIGGIGRRNTPQFSEAFPILTNPSEPVVALPTGSYADCARNAVLETSDTTNRGQSAQQAESKQDRAAIGKFSVSLLDKKFLNYLQGRSPESESVASIIKTTPDLGLYLSCSQERFEGKTAQMCLVMEMLERDELVPLEIVEPGTCLFYDLLGVHDPFFREATIAEIASGIVQLCDIDIHALLRKSDGTREKKRARQWSSRRKKRARKKADAAAVEEKEEEEEGDVGRVTSEGADYVMNRDALRRS